MSIYIFVRKSFDGNGDLAQAAKIANFVQQLTEHYQYPDDVSIVIPEEERDDITPFIVALNPKVKLMSKEAMKQSTSKINFIIEAGYSYCLTKNDIDDLKLGPIPKVLMEEYSLTGTREDNTIYDHIILGGFNTHELGVIPDLNSFKTMNDAELRHAFDQLPLLISKYLAKDSDTYVSQYRTQKRLAFEYSHNKDEDCTERFIRAHTILTNQTKESQDVILIGERKDSEGFQFTIPYLQKHEFTSERLRELHESGYSRVIFVNMDQDKTDVIFDDGGSGKEYRVLYTKSVPYTAMQALALLTTAGIAGTTGDHSLTEAMSHGLLVTYEWMLHKRMLIKGYLAAVANSTEHPGVIRLAEYLIYQRRAVKNYKETELQALLCDKECVLCLSNINKMLVHKNQYLQTLKELLITTGVITPPQQEDTLLIYNRKLLLELNSHSTGNTPSFNLKKEAAEAIQQLLISKISAFPIENSPLNEDERATIEKNLQKILNNKPVFQERLLVQKMVATLQSKSPILDFSFFPSTRNNMQVDVDVAIDAKPKMNDK